MCTLFLPSDPTTYFFSYAKKVFYLEEVLRLEDNLRAGLRGGGASGGAVAGVSPENDAYLADRIRSPATIPITDAEVQKHLETNKDRVRQEAVAAVLRRRDHLAAMREISANAA